MDFLEAYKVSQVIESLESYAYSGEALSDNVTDVVQEENTDERAIEVYTDAEFWSEVISGAIKWNDSVELRDVVLSEWIARVPGLYHTAESSKLRHAAESKVEFISNGKWTHYTPLGKSQKVSGGIGSILLPPDNGKYLCSISFTNNASTGIPVLISEEVWERCQLQEGRSFVSIKGKWRKMNTNWVSRFPSVAGIPKGYLELTDSSVLNCRYDELHPTVFHPFSIMEWEKKEGVFYDYVYVTVDSTEEGYREKIRYFMGEYEYFDGRNGRYLIEPFVNDPLLNNVEFMSPSDLRRSTPAAASQLQLLVERIQEATFNGETVENIKIAIDSNFENVQELAVLSDDIGLSPNAWRQGGRFVNESASFLETVINRKKIDVLIDTMVKDNPAIFDHL